MNERCIISVDLETDGSIPGDYSLSSIGACVADQPELQFKRLLKPISDQYDPKALAVSGLDREMLIRDGMEPPTAMQQWADWLESVCGGREPLFAANNAPFDWMFSHWYFIHFLGFDPFGHAAFDIRSYAMGVLRTDWQGSALKRLPHGLGLTSELSHDCLQDSLDQADVLRKVQNWADNH